MIFIYVYPIILFLISYLLLIKPVKASSLLKFIISIVLAVACCKNILVYLFGGDVLAPELPRNILIAASTIHVAVLFAIVMSLCIWFIKIFRKILIDRKGTFGSLNVYSVVFVLISSFLLSCYATYNALKDPIIHNYTFYSAKYPEATKSLRIVHISDSHLGSNTTVEQAAKYVNLVNEQNPDIVLFTGDLIDGRPEMSDLQLAEFKRIKAPMGLYAVRGNHEYYSKTAQWDSLWSKYGINMLDNAHITVELDGKPAFTIAGVNDIQSLKMVPTENGPDLAKALEGADSSLPVILMDHRPGAFPEYAKAGIDLVLSGHTHGGMLPILRDIIKKANNGYVSGLYRINDSKLIVNNCLFLWGGFLARIDDPAEIVVIDLIHQK